MTSHKIVSFQEDNFEQKLLALKDTQDSIQSLSSWCLKYQQQHKKVVGCWLHVLRKVKVEQRVTLFYLANDVIQYSKRKNYPFVDSWAPALQKATPLVRDDKIKHKILRLFKIWGQRNVYDEAFLSDLCGLITAKTKKSSVSTADLVHNFQTHELFSKVRKCKALEEDTDLKLKYYKKANLPAGDELKNMVESVFKDRRSGHNLLSTIEDGIGKLEAYSEALDLEIKERTVVINALEVGEQFYEHQRGEAKVVCNAYRNFGQRIKNLRKKLEALLPNLGSPVPSPDIDAPSPSSGSDFDLPDDNRMVQYNSEQSFIGMDFSSSVPASDQHMPYDPNASINSYSSQLDLSHMFNSSDYDRYMSKSANTSVTVYHEGNPIEVINSSQNENLDFNDGEMSKLPGIGSPPNGAHDLFNKPNVEGSLWADKPLTKYPSWPSSDSSWGTPQKSSPPPPFTRESYEGSANYVDTSRFPPPQFHDNCTLSEVNSRLDADSKFEGVSSIPLPERDVEDRHSSRNLIALTNSPSVNHTWKKTDTDYRFIPMPLTPPVFAASDSNGRSSKTPTDIIESVDMEMSDDDEVKHDEKNRSRRSSSKEEEERKDHQSQLMPPPNPWNMMNVGNTDADDENLTGNRRNDGIPKSQSNFADSMEGPSMPMPGYTHYPAPVRPDIPPTPNGMSAMNFSQPPPPQEAMFPPRANFPRQPPPNFNQPYNFFSYGDSNASHPPIFPPIGSANHNNQSLGPYSGDMQPRFQGQNPVPYQRNNPAFSNASGDDNCTRASVKTIEPLIKNRQSFDSFNSNTLSADTPGPSKARSNLKEICLSSVLEQTMRERDDEDPAEDEYCGISGMRADEFFDDANNENTGDDGDDLYNNIEETAFGDNERPDDAFEKENLNVGSEIKKQRIPFQGTVPKAARLPIAPSNIYDDDERNPCPILPVIDLSDENNSPNDQFDYNAQESTHDFHNTAFSRRGGPNQFPRGNQRFISPGGNQRFSGPRRGRFTSPRDDFRTRNAGEFSPFIMDQSRPSRPSYNRPPNDVSPRGNFQNSPRMHSGRPQRPFRRGW